MIWESREAEGTDDRMRTDTVMAELLSGLTSDEREWLLGKLLDISHEKPGIAVKLDSLVLQSQTNVSPTSEAFECLEEARKLLWLLGS